MRAHIICIFIISATQTHPYDYDLIIIGAGASGTIATQYALRSNKRLALVEGSNTDDRHMLHSDIPLKALINIAQAALTIKKAKELGIMIKDSSIQCNPIFQYIHQVVQKASALYSTKYFPDNGVTILSGKATFVDTHTIRIGEQKVTSDKFIIATGGEPYIPNIQGIEDVPYLTEDTFFKLKELPKSLIIIGEGPLGLEMATALNRLGVKVTVLTKHALILPKYDFELVEMQHQLMKMEGINIRYNMRVKQLEYTNNTIIATCRDKFNKERKFQSEQFLIALTRNGRTDFLNLDKIQIDTCLDGIIVNSKMQTSVPNIYACGNAVGQQYTLSRVGYYQAQIAAHNASKSFWQKDLVANYANASSFIYAARPLGASGITEQEARKKFGKNLLIYRFGYESCARAQIDNTTDGIAKFICDKKGTLLGVHVLGAAADRIIDSVRIGQNLSHQFADYILELRTAPNYLDIAWEASKRAEFDTDHNIFTTIMQYLRKVIPL